MNTNGSLEISFKSKISRPCMIKLGGQFFGWLKFTNLISVSQIKIDIIFRKYTTLCITHKNETKVKFVEIENFPILQKLVITWVLKLFELCQKSLPIFYQAKKITTTKLLKKSLHRRNIDYKPIFCSSCFLLKIW